MSFSAKESLKFYKKYSYDELVTTLSDYHKDIYGFRLRMNGEPLKEILRQLLFLDKHMADPRNRKELQDSGWIFDEPIKEEIVASMDPHPWGPGFGEE